MKTIQNFHESNRLSIGEMKTVNGGRKLIKCVFKSDGEGTYYELTYDDGSVEYVPHTWYA